MSLPELALPAEVLQWIIRDIRTAYQIRVALQSQGRVRTDDNAANQINVRLHDHGAAAVGRTEIKRRLEGCRVLGRAVALCAEVADIE